MGAFPAAEAEGFTFEQGDRVLFHTAINGAPMKGLVTYVSPSGRHARVRLGSGPHDIGDRWIKTMYLTLVARPLYVTPEEVAALRVIADRRRYAHFGGKSVLDDLIERALKAQEPSP